MEEHDTQPPSYLSETDLITLMDKSGIGTDATIHQHIKTIQDRKYAEKTATALFKPTPLGLGLVVGYSSIGTTLHNPELRAQMEKDMNEIINKTKNKTEVIIRILREMEDVFTIVRQRFSIILKAVKDAVVNNNVPEINNNPGTCFKCGISGHYANQCQNQRKHDTIQNLPPEKQIRCYKCGNLGHFANNCQGGQREVEINAARPEVKQIKCFKCQQIGHYASTCTNNMQSIKENNSISCTKCGKSGHFANNCQEIPKKQCSSCGVFGRHTKNSTCPLKTKKK